MSLLVLQNPPVRIRLQYRMYNFYLNYPVLHIPIHLILLHYDNGTKRRTIHIQR